MAKKTFTVTHPDGTVSKRTSESRDYAFAIEVGPADPEVYAAAQRRQAQECRDKADRFETALQVGRVKIRRESFRRNDGYERGTLMLDGTEVTEGRTRYHEVNAQGCVKVDGRWLYHALREHTDEHLAPVDLDQATLEAITPSFLRDDHDATWAYVDAKRQLVRNAKSKIAGLRNRAEEHEAAAERGPEDKGYGITRWSARRDLAEKALAEFDYLTSRDGRPLRVVPVDQA